VDDSKVENHEGKSTMNRPRSRMTVGVDGCRAGWLCVARSGNLFRAWISPDLASALARATPDAVFGIDMPIGLARTGARRCDDAARAFLGWPRSSSVFSAPVRGALQGTTYVDVCRLHRRIDGRAVSRQAFGLFNKLREVDALLRLHPQTATRVFEVHPEVSFALWRGRPMTHGKKSPQGRRERKALIKARWRKLVDRLDAQLPGSGYAQDDLLDAIAVLWSTIRHAAEDAILFPPDTERDEHGLRMQIVG
jgi:predicted RNase H-like nuclease